KSSILKISVKTGNAFNSLPVLPLFIYDISVSYPSASLGNQSLLRTYVAHPISIGKSDCKSSNLNIVIVPCKRNLY
ncbi:TPA: hypothetical protein ACKN4I_002232, partial [Neisseria gonorrhoeae]